MQFTGETNCSFRDSVTQLFKQILVTLEITAIATRGGCEIITVVQYVI